VLLDNSAIGLNGSVAGDGRPLARVGDETNVYRGILLEVVSLARLGVGVEEEVEAVSFLLLVSPLVPTAAVFTAHLRSQSHAP
jgi:hypothetical protein